MRNFREMIIWNQAVELVVRGYQLTKQLPKEEMFGLTSQLNRALVSMPSNIAEGCSRSSERDFSRFLEIALGSSYEVETQFVITEKLGYLNENIVQDYLATLKKQQKQTYTLISRLKS